MNLRSLALLSVLSLLMGGCAIGGPDVHEVVHKTDDQTDFALITMGEDMEVGRPDKGAIFVKESHPAREPVYHVLKEYRYYKHEADEDNIVGVPAYRDEEQTDIVIPIQYVSKIYRDSKGLWQVEHDIENLDSPLLIYYDLFDRLDSKYNSFLSLFDNKGRYIDSIDVVSTDRYEFREFEIRGIESQGVTTDTAVIDPNISEKWVTWHFMDAEASETKELLSELESKSDVTEDRIKFLAALADEAAEAAFRKPKERGHYVCDGMGSIAGVLEVDGDRIKIVEFGFIYNNGDQIGGGNHVFSNDFKVNDLNPKDAETSWDDSDNWGICSDQRFK